jgi:phenylacetate-CoA ligase
MEKITGRSDDMIILRGVNVFPTQIEEQLMTVQGLAPHFQLELDRVGHKDQMRVKCECTAASADPDARMRAGQELRHKIKSVVGVTVVVEVSDPGSVARSQGKAVRIVDNRPKDR